MDGARQPGRQHHGGAARVGAGRQPGRVALHRATKTRQAKQQPAKQPSVKRVGIVADRRMLDGMAVHQANDEYVCAIRDGAGATPLIIPSAATPLDAAEILSLVDGLLFTGAPSNVAPAHYGDLPRLGTELDEIRDATTLPLLRAAILAGTPLLAICRGFQELNVALGGSLHQHLHELPGRLDHRQPQNATPEAEYAPAHAITLAPDGMLAALSGLRQAM